MTVSAVSPCRTALQRDRRLPPSVVGPVLLSALRRLVCNCRNEVIVLCQNWVRFASRVAPGATRRRSRNSQTVDSLRIVASAKAARAIPQRACDGQGIDADLRPPAGFVPNAMDFAVMNSTQRHRELVAHLARHGARLGEAQMMGIARCSAANKTRLLRDEFTMLLVAQANCLLRRSVSPDRRN